MSVALCYRVRANWQVDCGGGKLFKGQPVAPIVNSVIRKLESLKIVALKRRTPNLEP